MMRTDRLCSFEPLLIIAIGHGGISIGGSIGLLFSSWFVNRLVEREGGEKEEEE
jgi:hypothetical protein